VGSVWSPGSGVGRQRRAQQPSPPLIPGRCRRVLPNPQMQQAGRVLPRSARARTSGVGQRNVGWCGRGHDRLQLICRSLDGTQRPLANVLGVDHAQETLDLEV